MFKYKLSRREKMLVGAFGVIVLILLWYFFVYQNTTSQISSINSEISNIETENTTNQQRVIEMNKMKESIDKHKANKDQVVTMPVYDNTKQLMTELNGILGAADTYKLSFGDIDITSSQYVLRPVQISFGCDSYATVENITRALSSGTYPCAINQLSFTDNTNVDRVTGTRVYGTTGASNYTASLTAVFFEEPSEEIQEQLRQQAEAEAAEAEAAAA